MNICCYHGTDKASLLSILSSEVFIVNRRSDHWLGNGVYFFVDDLEKAEWWADSVSRRNDKLPAVLYFDIEFNDAELLNLNTDADLGKLDEFATELFKSIESQTTIMMKFKNIHEQNCFVLDNFFKKNPNYKAVRRTFHSTNKNVGKSGFDMLSDQLCIMNQSIIPFSKIKIRYVS